MSIDHNIADDIARKHKAKGFLNKILKKDAFGVIDKTKQDRINSAYRACFCNGSEASEIVIQDLCKESGFYDVNWDCNGIKEGRRALFLHILKKVVE